MKEGFIHIPIIYPEVDPSGWRLNKDYALIYQYTTYDGKKYIGQTIDFAKRHRHHLYASEKNGCTVDYILAAHDYEVKVLWLGLRKYANDAERYFIKTLDTLSPKGWNFTPGGALDSKYVLNKQILRYDMYTGIFIAEYESVADASIAIGHADGSDVSACARGRRVYTGDSVFIYKERDEYPYKIDVSHVQEYLRQKHENISKSVTASHTGIKSSEEKKRKLSEIAKAQGRKPPSRKGVSSPLKGRKLTEEQKNKRYENILVNHPDYWAKIDRTKTSGKNQHRARSVYQRDREGNIIAEYETITEATKATGVGGSLISRCIRGLGKTAGGYIWTVSDEDYGLLGYSTEIPTLTKIQQFDLDGNLVAEYKNTVDAGKAVGTHPRNVSKAVNGYTDICNGYRWKKVNVADDN